MGVFSRILGICKTKRPLDSGSWKMEGNEVHLDLSRAPELAAADGALRLEGGGLPFRVLVIRGKVGGFYAYRNKCTHMGRRLDPVPGANQLECCSVSRSTFNLDGRAVHGPAKDHVSVLALEEKGKTLIIYLDEMHN